MVATLKQFVFNALTVLVSVTFAEYPYCFRFTWLGPYLDKDNIGDLTCATLHDDLNTIPCRQPLVATHNDRVPDTLQLWRKTYEEPTQFGCPLVPGESCVKYTYIYNKGIQNITYMCAKVNATSGCYRQRYISGLEVEVCVCQSRLNELPCNRSDSSDASAAMLLLSLLLLLYSLLRTKL